MNPSNLILALLFSLSSWFRFTLFYLVALIISVVVGFKIWYPIIKRFPPTWGDGIFELSDIYYAILFILSTALMLSPWILPLMEVL